MVWVVGLPAASLSVTVRLNGPPPGQVKATQVEELMAPTAAHAGVAAEPSVTQRLFWPGPSELGRPAASVESVWAQTLNRPLVSGARNWPAVGKLIVRSGGVV